MNLLTFNNGVIPFIWDRLPLTYQQDRGVSLREDWFAEDAVKAGSQFVWRGHSPEESHRLLYRYATLRAWGQGRYGGAPETLLLHQMVELIPALVMAAGDVLEDQREAAE